MFLSKLKTPDAATSIGVITAAGVYLIYNNAVPNLTDVRAAAPHDKDVESERKSAAIKSVVLIAAVFLVARDINSYIISGAALVGMDLMTKHANAVNPATGKMDSAVASSADGQSIGGAGMYSLPSYSDTGTD